MRTHVALAIAAIIVAAGFAAAGAPGFARLGNSSPSAVINPSAEYKLGNYTVTPEAQSVNVSSGGVWTLISPTLVISKSGSIDYYQTESVGVKWNNQSKAHDIFLSFRTGYGNLTLVAYPDMFSGALDIQYAGVGNYNIFTGFSNSAPVNATASSPFLQHSDFNRNSSARNVLSNYDTSMYENFGSSNMTITWSGNLGGTLYEVYSTQGTLASLKVLSTGSFSFGVKMEQKQGGQQNG